MYHYHCTEGNVHLLQYNNLQHRHINITCGTAPYILVYSTASQTKPNNINKHKILQLTPQHTQC